jgi:hypothetical protein
MRYGKHLTLAFRSLRSGGRFTLAVLLLLALGVGTTTSMFSVVNGVLLRPLALPDPGQLMLIGERLPQMPQTAGLAWFDSLAAFSAWQREASAFTGMSLVIAGLAGALTTAVLTAPLLRSQLFHVSPTNPAVLVTAAATVGIAAVCACLGPAYRATRTDPLPALRAD